MRVYRKIVFNPKGEVVFEDSFEYDGEIALCKGGALRAQREAEEQARRSYQLQLEQMEFQKKQAEKLEQGESAEEAKKAATLQRRVELGKKGMTSTITTIRKKPSFADFEAKYTAENPVTPGMTADEYTKKLKEAYAKILPFNRLITGQPTLKKKELYAS